ncbi:putative thyroid hormone receptor interactor [Tripterygium wilfordii]|uniref:Pachytene checkpoint protein 2 homolog n=1 Tax=Tripterygium wilfordii TaxID=458696 RepID=A0A7J7CDH2_TRIWF|nr:pachytene checkpoint protein 2 homolog [Tripterygium wilfordii]KAF5732178.1 putative thyroid hormone receptor interactor [Tripterygium wilfordii]
MEPTAESLNPQEMTIPMEVTESNPSVGAQVTTPNGIAESTVTEPSLTLTEDKYLVSVEVRLKPSSTARTEDVRLAVERMLEKRSLSYVDGAIPVPPDDPFLLDNVESICICDTEEWVNNHDILLFWQVKPVVHVFQLSEEGPCEELSGDGQLSSFNEWILPAKEFDGLWESLIYESGLKQRLLRYAASALLFTEKAVNPFLVSWNRIVLLHGPPGTGKTSLCKALAQKLSIRFSLRYPQCQLIEVNAHSLFSKWFSESGKLVAKLFQKIQEMVEEENNLVFVLIDEVESLAAARKAALSGSEPSDSIRVVNALLTQMDKLKSSPNVIILTTSNITAAIDIAFVDRADIKAYVGPPTLQARYEILRSCFHELMRTGIISTNKEDGHLIFPNYATMKEKLSMPELQVVEAPLHLCKQLLEVAEACEGLSGRSLRKLPFLAHSALTNPYSCNISRFLCTMMDSAKRERSEVPE